MKDGTAPACSDGTETLTIVHKDRPPGIFDFAERSLRHTTGMGLVAGFILSILVHVGILIWHAGAVSFGPTSAEAEAAESAVATTR